MARKEIALDVRVNNIDDATDQFNGLESSIDDVRAASKKTTDQMEGGFKAAKGGAEAASKGVKGLSATVGTLVKSLGIIAILTEAFLKLKEMLMSNQTIADAFSTAMVAMETVFKRLIEAGLELGTTLFNTFNDPKKALTDFYTDLRDTVIEGFKWLGEVAGSVGKILKGVFTFDWEEVAVGVGELGNKWEDVKDAVSETWEGIKDGVKEFVKDLKDATNAAIANAAALVKLRNEVLLLEAGQKKVQMTYQREAELQRQIRDDVRKTLAERIEANKRLGKVLEDQIAEEEKIFVKRLQLAEMELALDTSNIQKKAEVLRAEGELADLRERIAGQRSEQLTNEAALEQELFDLQQQVRLEQITGRQREVEELQQHYDQLSDIARRAGEDMFEIEAARARAISELNDKFRQEDLEKEKQAQLEKIKVEQQTADARITAATEVSNALGQAANFLAQQGKEGLALSKIITGSQILIDTARGISSAIAGATQAAAAGGPAAPFLQAAYIASMVGTVIGSIAQATALLRKVPEGGNISTPSFSSSAITAPSISPVTTNTTELGNSQQAQLAPIQAFVVETQLTGTQNNINQIQSQATFGV